MDATIFVSGEINDSIYQKAYFTLKVKKIIYMFLMGIGLVFSSRQN
jgi:hypothetical protein